MGGRRERVAALACLLAFAQAGARAADPDVSLSAGLVGYWKLDDGPGSATAADSSGNGRTAKLVGSMDRNAAWVGGRPGGALSFDGADDGVDLPTSVGLTSRRGSVSFWFSSRGISEDAGHVFYGSPSDKGDGYGDQDEFHVALKKNGCVEFFAKGHAKGGVGVRSRDGLADGRWHHVCATWDAAGPALALHVDGARAASAGRAWKSFGFTRRLRLGKPGRTVRLYRGLLDEVRVYDRALSPDEVAALFAGGGAEARGPVKGLVGRWVLDEGAGTVARDASGGGRDGSITGGTWTDAGPGGGRALRFDGRSTRVDVAADAALGVTSMTLAAWVFIPGPVPQGWRTIVEHDRKGGNWYGLWKSQSGQLFHFRWSKDGNCMTDSAGSVSPDTWHHFTGTFDAATGVARTYLDGKHDRTVTGGARGGARTAPLRIGMNIEDGEPFPGITRDVRVYDRALATNEVAALYAGGGRAGVRARAPAEGLVGHWMFDDGVGDTARDASGKGGDGSITGGRWTKGKLGGALELGPGSRVDMPGGKGLRESFTVAFWLDPRSRRDYNQVVRAAGGWERFMFHTAASGGVYCGIDLATRFTPDELPADTVVLNRWQHFAHTFGGKTGRFYKDGKLLATKPHNLPRPWDGLLLAEIEGLIDDVRVYERALAADEVAALAAAGAAGPARPTLPAFGPRGGRTYYLRPGDVVLFMGDAVTADGGFIELLRADTRRKYPSLLGGGGAAGAGVGGGRVSAVKFVNAGAAGETAREGKNRARGLVQEYKATVAVVCYGANDILRERGSFALGMGSLVRELRAASVAVTVLAPPCLDAKGRPELEPFASAQRAAVDGLRLLAARERAVFADCWTPGRKRIDSGDEITWGDGIHPNDAGRRIIADALGSAWGLGKPLAGQ